MKSRIYTITAAQIAAGQSFSTQAIDMTANQGLLSVQIEVAGDGTLSVEWIGSNDEVDFMVFDGENPVKTGITSASGPAADGKILLSAEPGVCASGKVKFTETGGADSVTITAHICVR